MNAPDRYVSFCGLDCEQRASALVARICQLAQRLEPENRLWRLFGAKVEDPNGPDALFLVHSYIFYMRELLENHRDHDGLRLLEGIETDCC